MPANHHLAVPPAPAPRSSRREELGSVYLLCFVDTAGQPARYRHAGHYLGWAKDVQARLAVQRQGRGARLVQVVLAAGLDVVLVRTWPGTRLLERQLKNRHEAPRLCPRCADPTTPASGPPARGQATPTPAGTGPAGRPGPTPPGTPTRPGLVLSAGQTRHAVELLDAAARYWGAGDPGRAGRARALAAALAPAATQGRLARLDPEQARGLPQLLRDGARWAGRADDPGWLVDGFALALHFERALASPERTAERAGPRRPAPTRTSPARERGHGR
jgi:hypothetical protein